MTAKGVRTISCDKPGCSTIIMRDNNNPYDNSTYDWVDISANFLGSAESIMYKKENKHLCPEHAKAFSIWMGWEEM